jgi:hypothetical protein
MQVGFVIKSSQLDGLHSLIGNNSNKIMAIALLIALLQPTP